MLSDTKSDHEEWVSWVYGECCGLSHHSESRGVRGNAYWLTLFSSVRRGQLGYNKAGRGDALSNRYRKKDSHR